MQTAGCVAACSRHSRQYQLAEAVCLLHHRPGWRRMYRLPTCYALTNVRHSGPHTSPHQLVYVESTTCALLLQPQCAPV